MPIPLIPEHRDRTRCRWMLCHNEGTKECIGCIGATPRAKYCSRKCQTQDWSFHKKYCGKKVYTFKIKLLGSKDPVIKRTVDVPAWFTFQELHFVIQYAFGPWQQYHQHQFSFHSAPPGRGGATHMAPDTELLRVIADEDEHNEAYRVRRLAVLKEKEVRLFDVYGSEGRHRAQVDVYGDVLPMIYTYDFKIRTTGSTLSPS
ncbi:hypothetical protein BD626DRAFT_155108 [Schizophyllum amplum]|uniref:MYND-type domain-containing protein n=1 Tax=Schizophyllum amplum TaxID=97359 RepID=A0A550C410_9AGAR|nr:hypothetical protein BD626DRAFT_155108 [Auriculariopsis ampla]